MSFISTHIYRSIVFFLLISATFIFSACEDAGMYDKNIAIADDGWTYDDSKEFVINILDTASSYNMYVNVRHTDEYPYNNVWMKVTTIFPDSTTQQGRINLQISEPDGVWTGNCADGVCYNSVPIQQNFKFQMPGEYTFILQQDMRINPLPSIMHVGLKIEKFISPG